MSGHVANVADANIEETTNFNHIVTHMHGENDPDSSRSIWFDEPRYPISFGVSIPFLS